MDSAEWAALIGAGAAIIGGLVSGALGIMWDWWRRPILRLDFLPNQNEFVVESTYKGEKGILETSTYVRIELTNVGTVTARDVRVFLTDIREVLPAAVHATTFYDAKPLKWAGYPEDYGSRSIPRGIRSYVDLLHISKGDRLWHFEVKTLFASQEHLQSRKGTYRITATATSENASPTFITLDVSFDGDYDGLRVSYFRAQQTYLGVIQTLIRALGYRFCYFSVAM